LALKEFDRNLERKLKRIDAVDSLRGIAALAVAVAHIIQQQIAETSSWDAASPVIRWLGPWGVTLFFVLSGFCIHLPLATQWNQGFNPRHFMVARALRILPAYIVCIALALISAVALPTPLLRGGDWRDVALHLMFVHTWFPDTFYSINAVFWTIALEIQFYAVYCLVASKLRFTILGCLALLSLALGAYYLASITLPHGDPWRLVGQNTFFIHFWKWYLGAAIAELSVGGMGRRWIDRQSDLAINTAFWLVLAMNLAHGYIDPVVGGLHVVFWIAPLFCSGLIFVAACRRFRPFIISRRLVGNGLRWIGITSYSLYLFHPIAIGIGKLIAGMGVFASVLSFVFALMMATFFYRTVEKPCLQLRNRH